MLAIPVTLFAVGPAAFGAFPEDLNPPAEVEAAPAAQAVAPSIAPAQPAVVRPAPPKGAGPPAPPRKYLEAGIDLFNKADYDLARKYLGAAHTYRDRLTDNERVVLDVYHEKLDKYTRERQAAASRPRDAGDPRDAGVVAASTAGIRPMGGRDAARLLDPDAPEPRRPTEPGKLPDARPARGTETWRDTADTKQKARWMLHVAREQIFRGQYDGAVRTVAEVQGMNVRWGFFDDTPAKVSETLAKARSKPADGATGNPDTSREQPHDRRTAKARLRDARALLAAGDLKTAESIALAVRSWDLRYGLFDDTPAKVVAAVDEVRRHDSGRGDEPTLRSYLGVRAGRRPEPPRGADPSPPTELDPAAPGPR